MAKPMPAELAELGHALSQTGPLESKSMIKTSGLAINGAVFAIYVNDAIVLKLPEDTVRELVEMDRGQPFGMGGRIMREWVSLDGMDLAEQVTLAETSRTYVASLPARPKRARKTGA